MRAREAARESKGEGEFMSLFDYLNSAPHLRPQVRDCIGRSYLSSLTHSTGDRTRMDGAWSTGESLDRYPDAFPWTRHDLTTRRSSQKPTISLVRDRPAGQLARVARPHLY